MAAILITVKNNLYTIQLDQWDWTGLTVNNTVVPKVDGKWTYVQTTPGPVDFSATANYVTTVNPDGNNFPMTGTSNTHLALLAYSAKGQPFQLDGVLLNVSPRSYAQPGPFPFSQGKMTGVFQHG
jgi:hypothetical protein